MSAADLPRTHLGFGIGLRTVHYREILGRWPAMDWFEVISENFMDTDGRPLDVLDAVASRYPVVCHGVGLSIGGTDPLDRDYLRRLRRLVERVKSPIVSDHLCFTGVSGRETHDLLPLPYTEAALRHVVRRVRAVQDALGRPLVLENPSSYLAYTASTMPEWEFLGRLAEAADCGIQLDVNNVYVSSVNHGFDPMDYVRGIPHARVVYFHLAGHTHKGTHLLDTHTGAVISPVWALYREAYRLGGGRSTMLEWDADIPRFARVRAEVEKARRLVHGPPARPAPRRARTTELAADGGTPRERRGIREAAPR